MEQFLLNTKWETDSLLTCDLFSAHRSQESLKTYKRLGLAVRFVPGGCTSVSQPLDLFINRSFKCNLRRIYRQWTQFLTNYRPPTEVELLVFIKKAWDQVNSELICKSFLFAGLSFEDDPLVGSNAIGLRFQNPQAAISELNKIYTNDEIECLDSVNGEELVGFLDLCNDFNESAVETNAIPSVTSVEASLAKFPLLQIESPPNIINTKCSVEGCNVQVCWDSCLICKHAFCRRCALTCLEQQKCLWCLKSIKNEYAVEKIENPQVSYS